MILDNKKIAILSIVAFVVSLIVFGTTLYLVFFRTPVANGEGSPSKPRATYRHDIGEFSTNIGSSGRYFKGNIVVESGNKKTPAELEKNIEPVRDAVIQILMGQDLKQMMTPSGMQVIRDSITKSLTEILGINDITNIYFTDYIIQ